MNWDRLLERAVIWGSGVGAVVLALSILAAFIEEFLPVAFDDLSIHLAMAAILVLDVIAILAFGIDKLTTRSSGSRYESQRRTGRLRAATVVMRALAWISTALLILAIVVRSGVISWDPGSGAVRRGALMLAVAMSGSAIYAQYHAMHVESQRDRSDLRRMTAVLPAIISGGLAIMASSIAYADDFILGDDWLHSEDAAMLLLASAVLLALTITVTRALPSMATSVLVPARLTAGGYTPESRANVAPTVVAFTVLGGFLLVLVLFSAGILSVLQQAGENSLVLIALLFMVAAVGIGIYLSVRTGRQQDRPALYKQATETEQRERAIILSISLPLAALLVFAGWMATTGRTLGGMPEASWIHLVTLGLLTGVGPYGYYAGKRQRRIRLMEERFPDFLRDLASSHRGGLTLVAAVQVASRGEYGPLSPEITKMADQLTWHVSFDEALQRMADRVGTPLVRRTVSLILEASRSGGNTTDVLMAAARDARELKTLERQRRINMSVYTIVIYVVFFVFLFVIGVLYAQFVPEILKAHEATKSSQFEGVGGLDFGGVSLEDYRRFYFTGGAVQALGNGILAGVMGNGSAALGLRHAFVMILSTYLTFAFLL